MPAIVRKLVIYAAVDGLVLQPLAQRGQRPTTPVIIDYTTQHDVRPLLQYSQIEQHTDKQIECFGVVGLLKVSSYAYVITISRRQQVAQIFGKSIYVITGVSVIPLGSQAEAQQAIDHTQKLAKKHKDKPEQEDEDIQSDTEGTVEGTVDNDHSVDSDREIPEPSRGRPSVDLGELGVGKNVIEKKGVYGIFADKWFSKRGWTTSSKKAQGMSDKHDNTVELEDKNPINVAAEDTTAEKSSEDSSKSWPENPKVQDKLAEEMSAVEQERLTTSLIPKLIQTTKLLLSSRIFFFSYDQDITNRNIGQASPSSDLPLHKRANPEYFWNDHLSAPFVEAGFTEYVLPVMQGFVGQRDFVVRGDTGVTESTSEVKDAAEIISNDPPLSETSSGAAQFDLKTKTFLITLISRRSVKRNGLRYLRRGIDEEGNVANAVETEQILSAPNWENEQGVHSFVQCRGSIPLFFSQIPYSFKPVPTLQGTPEANQRAMKRHYTDLQAKYGDIQCISLIDRHGTEPKIGQAYEDNLQQLNSAGGINNKTIGFNWWEFHHICRGMKFENVALLVSDTADFLTTSSWTSPTTKQSGIIRTNCMDCLDRTNVVQTAFAQHVLELQLSSLGYPTSLSTIPMPWFNTLWADAGDAIARCYTGTSALKGDYTRTRKRNVLGALNDFSLTLSRYYQNLFDDFFAQAAIDYLLGVATEDVFLEFEATMTTADPAVDVDRARQSAIHGAADIVISHGEDMIAGYALASPAHPNTLRTYPFEETLLLLTEAAIYFVRFDWATEKVQSFERVEIERLFGVQWGAYITETNTKRQMDAKRNVGFVVRYKVSEGDEGIKVFTRSLEAAETSTAAEVVENGGAEAELGTESQGQSSGSAGVPEDAHTEHNDANVTQATKKTAEQAKTKAKKASIPKDAQASKASTFKHSASSDADEIRFYAFKALPPRSQSSTSKTKQQSEHDLIYQICTEIERCVKHRLVLNDHEEEGKGKSTDEQVEANMAGAEEADKVEHERAKQQRVFELIEGDIISADEARRSTGYLETLGYSLKKLVWG